MAYDPFWNMIKKFIKQLEEQMKELEEKGFLAPISPEDLTKNLNFNKPGIFFYGYSVTMGPDGKPIIREFGNAPWLAKEAKIGPPSGIKVLDNEDIVVEVYDKGK